MSARATGPRRPRPSTHMVAIHLVEQELARQLLIVLLERDELVGGPRAADDAEDEELPGLCAQSSQRSRSATRRARRCVCWALRMVGRARTRKVWRLAEGAREEDDGGAGEGARDGGCQPHALSHLAARTRPPEPAVSRREARERRRRRTHLRRHNLGTTVTVHAPRGGRRRRAAAECAAPHSTGGPRHSSEHQCDTSRLDSTAAGRVTHTCRSTRAHRPQWRGLSGSVWPRSRGTHYEIRWQCTHMPRKHVRHNRQ